MQIDLANPDLYADGIPHAVFARLRVEAPVYFNAEANGPGFQRLAAPNR